MSIHEEKQIAGKFLALLDGDILKNPERLQLLDTDYFQRLRSLVGNAVFDLDKPLPDED